MNMSFPHGPGRVGAEQAVALTGDGDAVLLDVREGDEWQAGHAPGALHLPLSLLEHGAALPEEARGRLLVVVCRSGNRSRRAAELLTARGAEAVDMIGGMREWARTGLPVVNALGEGGTVA